MGEDGNTEDGKGVDWLSFRRPHRTGRNWTGKDRSGWDRRGPLSCIHSGMEWRGEDWRGLEGNGMAFFQASTLDRTGAERK